MEIKIAVYPDGKAYADEDRIYWHVYRGAKVVHVEFDFEKIPDPKAVFGVGIVTNLIAKD